MGDIKKCKTCNKEMVKSKYEAESYFKKKLFCSRECFHKFYKANHAFIWKGNWYKKCNKCAKKQPVENFWNHALTTDKKNPSCKKCQKKATNENAKKKYWRDPEAARQKNREKHIRLKEFYRQWSKNNHQKTKMLVLKKYGGDPPKCACCGEKTIKFLSLDHKNGNGKADRRRYGASSSTMYKIAIERNDPEVYQILCYNCNCAKGFFGKCPHLEVAPK